MKFKLHGTDQMQKQLRRIAKNVQQQIDPALVGEAEAILLDTDPPIKTGALRDSGHVTSDSTSRTSRATIGYDAEYSPYVHEDLEADHSIFGGEPKFLERAMRRAQPDLAARLGKRINVEKK